MSFVPSSDTQDVVASGDAIAEQESVFRRCYSSVLKLADENGIMTIAFPSIGTGAFGWPFARASELAMEEVTAHLAGGGKQTKITFCCFAAPDRERYERLISGLTG